jgi:hypothetical protein
MPRFTPAQQRYNRRVLALGLVYAVVLMGAIYVIKHQLVAGAAAIAIGILPGLAVSGFFLLLLRYLVEETDEYQRFLQVRQILIATGLALSIETIWGFLEGFGLASHILAWNWAVIWFVALGIGGGVNWLLERGRA